MHFTIQTAALRAAIDIVSHASVVTAVTPILENILVSVRFQKVVLVTNNLEMAIEYTIDSGVETHSEGEFTVSSRFLASFVALVQDEQLDIERLDGDSLEFRTTTSTTRVKGADAGKFPVLPSMKSDFEPFPLPVEDLKKAFEKTAFSTADGSIRPTLAGVYLRVSESSVAFASTDSFRLSEYLLEHRTGVDREIRMIVPKKTVMDLTRIFDGEKTVRIAVHESQILFVTDNVRVFSRLLNGHFPDYTNFFPKSHSTKGVVRRQDLINALKRINLISKENNFNSRFAFEAEKGLTIDTGDTEIGAGRVTLPASIEGEDATVGMNSTYLLDVLNVMREDFVSVDFETNLSPVMVRSVPEKTDRATYRHIIMPLKI
jgi:DNA polymerase III subunit beta